MVIIRQLQLQILKDVVWIVAQIKTAHVMEVRVDSKRIRAIILLHMANMVLYMMPWQFSILMGEMLIRKVMKQHDITIDGESNDDEQIHDTMV